MHCADAAAADHDVLTLYLMENAGAAAADFGPGLIADRLPGVLRSLAMEYCFPG
tara:strand:- start:29 stop:190 length:162 start_codon:yes stop_codon:yes gene_type:complete